MRQQTRPSMGQIIACYLLGTKPFSEPMLAYYKFEHWEQNSVKFESKYNNFHTRKSIWKCRMQNGGNVVRHVDPHPCVLVGNVVHVWGERIWKKKWWRNDMNTLPPLLALCEENPRSPVGSPHQGLVMWNVGFCPACRTTFIATRFRVAVICPIIPVPHCIRVFFYFVWFVFINHIFQFYYELCTYCNILDIYLS